MCGCPVDLASLDAQPVKITGVKISKKIKIIILCVVLTVIVVIASSVGILYTQQQTNAENYGENLEMAVSTMISGAAEAESCGNLIKQVWYNAIYEEHDEETDPFTCPYGHFVLDFNDALENLFSDKSFSEQIDNIQLNQSMVQALMKELQNPPEEYAEAYEALSEFYDAYLNLTNLAISPSGNLQTFSSNFNDADAAALNCYKAMSLYLDS